MKTKFSIIPHQEPGALMNHIFKNIGFHNSEKGKLNLKGIINITYQFAQKSNNVFSFVEDVELQRLVVKKDGSEYFTVSQYNEVGDFPSAPNAVIPEPQY